MENCKLKIKIKIHQFLEDFLTKFTYVKFGTKQSKPTKLWL
jgi:hypothetical protein